MRGEEIRDTIEDMASSEQTTTWTVEGSNWTWSGDLAGTMPADEVATRAVEEVSCWAKGDGVLRGDLKIRGTDMPKVGAIMMVSNLNMGSIDEHLVVLSAAVMANAGMHRAATLLRGEDP